MPVDDIRAINKVKTGTGSRKPGALSEVTADGHNGLLRGPVHGRTHVNVPFSSQF